MSVTWESKLWITHIWISNSPEVNLHMYHFSCPFQCYVQCSVILSSRYGIWFFANHHWNLTFSGNCEVLHTTSTTMYIRIPVFWNVTLYQLIIGSWCFQNRSPSSPKLQDPWTFNPRRPNIRQNVRNHLPINAVTHTRKPESLITIEKNSHNVHIIQLYNIPDKGS